MSIVSRPLMTLEDVLALPDDDDVDREVIRGQLREYGMTRRNRWHADTESTIVHLLQSWLDIQPKPRGRVFSGEAGFRIAREPMTLVGIDVAYISARQWAETSADSVFLEGPPVLAVEVLSPSDTKKRIDEKSAEYLRAGVALIWLVDPTLKTVTVLRPDADPELFNVRHELTAEPHLPGFRVRVAEIFE